MIKTRDKRLFPSSDVSRRTSNPVVRVLTPWPGGRSAHLIGALRAYLSRSGQPLPPDPGPGGYPIAARLDRRLIAKAKAMAGESSQAALIRRILLWRYFQKPVAASASIPSNPSAVPVSNSAKLTAQPARSPGVNEVPAPKNLSDQEYIRRLYEGKISP